MSRTYEEIARLLEAVTTPVADGQFHIEWLDVKRIGIGRDAQQRYALLIVGPPLSPRIDVVASNIRPGTWSTSAGEALQGSVLQLPEGDAFRTATATIAAELFRRGLETRPVSQVFAEVEPFIALVLRRMMLPDDYVLGLVGELIILRELLIALGDARRSVADPSAWWRGCQQQSRDFVLPAASIEVKTTGLSVSRHTISNLDQVEPRSIHGDTLERLFIASVGLRRATGSAGLSIASLADDIVALLREGRADDDPAVTKFLARLAEYGPEGFDGYRHPLMRDQDPYKTAFTTTFSPRIYDMSDQNIRIIRRADLARDFQFVLPQGLAYTLELPGAVPGSIENPRADLLAFLRSIVGAVEG
jgi:hypothetical protein